MDFNQNNADNFNQGNTGGMFPNVSKVATKKEFAKLPELKTVRSCIVASAILCYFSAAVTFILVVVLSGQIFSIIDVAILVALGVILQVTYSFPASIVLLAYAAFNVIATLITMGQFSGWLILLAGVDALIYTIKLNRYWKEYQATGVIPDNAR